MIPVRAVESLILDSVQPIAELAEIDIREDSLLGRILGEDIYSDSDFPLWDNAAMDGYAICCEDLEEFATLAITSTDIPAGSSEIISIGRGQAMRIFTGGMMPKGADTVVMQEEVNVIKGEVGDRLEILNIPKYREYVRPQGEFVRGGDQVLSCGMRINPAAIGILAAIQKPIVKVYQPPRIGIISTGNELREINQNLQLGQIVDSNAYTLGALIRECGAIPIFAGIVSDRPEDLRRLITETLKDSDMVISSGGVSVGDYDYVERVLEDLGADILVRSCAIKPGKPLTVASFKDGFRRNKVYIGIAGNPASVMVCFHRLIKGAIAKLSGANESYWYPKYIQVKTLGDLHAQGRRETYLWGHLNWDRHRSRWEFQPVCDSSLTSTNALGYSSGNLISWADVNGLAVLKVNQTYVPQGDLVDVMMI